jgi:hypothetical protein
MSTIDLSKLPPVLPINVQRVVDEGLPSKPLIDWETYTRDWYARNLKAIDNALVDHTKLLITLHDENETAKANINILFLTKVTADEALAIAQIELKAQVDNGTIASTASVTETLQAYATKDQAVAISQDVLATEIKSGNVVSSTSLSLTLQGYSTTGQSTASANLAIDARIATGEIINNVSLSTTLTGYTTPTQATGYAITAINASVNNGTLQAGLTTTQLVNIDAAGTMSLRYSLIGGFGGSQFGGFVFTGVQRLDNTGPAFLLEIFANVVIHGSLNVDGTVTQAEIANNSATQTTWAIGSNAASLGFTTRGGLIAIEATREADAQTVNLSQVSANLPALEQFGTIDVLVNGGIVRSTPLNTSTYYFYDQFRASGAIVSFVSHLSQRVLNTTIIYLTQLAPGTYTLGAQQGGAVLTGGAVTLKITEYLR